MLVCDKCGRVGQEAVASYVLGIKVLGTEEGRNVVDCVDLCIGCQERLLAQVRLYCTPNDEVVRRVAG